MGAAVVIYTTGYCPYCSRAKSLLSQKQAAFKEVDVEDRPDIRAWLVQASGQRTVPQVFVNGKPLGGFTDIAALDRKGELDRLLETPPSGTDRPVMV
jgi:glutaredoxin 3